MADETINTRIVANADFSNLIADVHKVTASLSKLQEQLANSNKMLANQIAVMNRSFSDTLRSTGQFSTHFVSLTSDVEKFGKNLDGGRLKLRDYFNTFQGHVKTSGGLIRDLARQQVAMQNAVLQPLGRNAQGLMQFNVHVPRGLDAIKNKTAIARQELQIMNRVIQDGSVQLINWGKNTQWAGRQLTVGLTLPLAAFGKAAADAFKTADQELTRLTKVYGDVAGTSAQELGKVRKEVAATAQQLSSAMGVNFQETIALAADIAATGKTGNELLSSVSETTRLAVLGEVDRQEAMKATLAIQSAFKQNTDELSESINFLNAVENQTSTTLNDLVEAIPKAGPVIKGLGGSVQDLALYLTAMREGGVSASEGANALKSALASLINPTDVAVAKFEGFGIDLLGIVNKNAGDVTGTLFALQAALDRLNPLQKQQAIEQLFGKFQFSRLNALFENLGRQGSQTLQVLDLMKASAGELEAVASRELAAVTESAAGKYRRAVEGLKAELATVGEEFLKINTVVVNGISKVLEFINNLPKPIKQILTFLGGLTAVAGPLIMLTGVLANFFGYILKGVMHMKAFFKGGEGWKYLTPEMLAAEKAGRLVEQSFYDDAKAAAILQTALRNLIDEFSILETKAKSGAISVNPAVSTMAGNLVMGAGVRVVDPNNPLAGPLGSRASTHMVPRAGMSEQQRMAQTIFGLVPGSIPVNRKIGDSPQIYMNEPLPPVPGLTTVGGVSTGVVAPEAARWHAMMATLAMQSKAEIESLKKQIAATGVVSKDFMMQFDDILPIVSKLTDNAAKQSALIVAELRAGKMTVDQARAQIIALNLETERMITQAVGAQAATMGRTLNPTVVPTLDQPVVDPTGKSNMRELFKKSKTRDLIDKVARSLGVRTSGAGYNIETTRPKKFNKGGPVYLNKGNIVPGSGNTDTVPAMLTPGEFVVNKEATQANLPLLQAINNSTLGGQASAGRGNYGRTGNTGYNSGDISSLYDYLDYLTSDAYDQSFRQNAILNDATALLDSGMVSSVEQAIDIATKDVDQALKVSRGEESTYRQVRDIQANRRGLNTGRVGTRQPVNAANRTAIAKVLRSRGNTLVADYAHRAHLSPISFTETNRGYYGQAVHDRWNSFSNTLSQRIPEIPDRVPVSSAGGAARADLIARQLGFENHADMLFRRAEVEQIAQTGRTPRGRTAPIGIFRFLRTQLPGAAVAAATRGRIRMNRGGMVPGVQYMEEGGVARPSMMRGMALGTGVAIGGSMLGSAVGGGMGTAISTAASLASMGMMFGGPRGEGQKGFFGTQLDKIPAKARQPIGPLNNLSKAAASTANGLTGISRAVGPILRGFSALLRVASPLGLAITGVAVALGFGINKYKEYQEQQRLARLEFGMTGESAQKAGLKFTDYNKTIKDAIANAKAVAERNHMIYESMTMANTPLKMTIEQYKKLRSQVKETMGDYIKLFDQTDKADVGSLATRLKAQFMAAGDSAETATAKIYALIAESNKASQAATVIGSTAFKSIKTLQDAAAQSISTFEGALESSDLQGQAGSLFSAFQAIDVAVEDVVRKSEDAAKKNKGSILTVGEAQKQVFDKLSNQFKNQKTLSTALIGEIKKISPELGKVLNSTDTITSAWSKYQLIVRGVNVDLSSMTGTAANAAMAIMSSVDTLTTSYLKSNVATKGLYDKYGNLTNRIKELQKAAKGQSAQEQIDSRKAIEALNKRIAKIREAADAKIKAMRSQAEAENNALQLQKLQLQYQEALARGDQDAAAQAQIELQQFNNQVQSKKAEESILAKAELEIAPLQKQIDALNKKNQDLADKASLAGDSLGKLQDQAAKLKDQIDNLNSALSRVLLNRLLDPSYAGSQRERDDIAAYRKAAGDAGILGTPTKPKGVAKSPDEAKNRYEADQKVIYGAADSLLAGLQKSIEKNGIVAKNVTIYAQEAKQGSAKSTSIAVTSTTSGGTTTYSTSLSSLAANNTSATVGTQFFDKNGQRYEITAVNGQARTATLSRKAMGGMVIKRAQMGLQSAYGSQPYLVGERGPELFVPSSGGQIIPNNLLGARFNVPSNTISHIPNGAVNSSSNNNTYTINIELNGTNITPDDIMRKFKSELALINAKEGRSRNLGGNY